MSEGKLVFLISGLYSNTAKSAKQTILFTLRGRELAVAELVNFILREVVKLGESREKDRLVETEVAESLSAMQDGDIWDGPISRAAKKAVKKAEQELWQALESLDLKEKRKRKQKEINIKLKSCHKITEFFKKKQECGNKPSATARNATPLSSKHDSDIKMGNLDAEAEMEWEHRHEKR